MVNINELAEQLANITSEEIAQLKKILKEEYHIHYYDDVASSQPNGMTFGAAIACLKDGKKVARKGWNGKGMWLWLKKGAMIKSVWCHDQALKEIADNNNGEIEGLPTICMKTADNKILTGWLASQTDMLSNDWIIVD